GICAEIVVGVAARDRDGPRLAVHSCDFELSGRRAGVDVLTLLGGSGLGAFDGARTHRQCRNRADRPLLVVGHDDVRERHVAGVGHDVRPGYRTADKYQRTRCRVAVEAVRLLDDGDPWIGTEVVVRVGA